MADQIVPGARYFSRATPQNTLNQIEEGVEVRVSFLDAVDASFEMIGNNGRYPRRDMRITRQAFGANFRSDDTSLVPNVNRAYVRSKHFTTRYK